ncbi:MAG: hypothetical protein ACREVK_08150 [Gammaproteobacteria bacterium]
MDAAVLTAYGWSDVKVPPFCPRTPEEQDALEAFQDEVIDRLFVLNAERGEQEQLKGVAAKLRTTRRKEEGKQAKEVQAQRAMDF